jgi:hypothetical protein
MKQESLQEKEELPSSCFSFRKLATLVVSNSPDAAE